MNRLLLHSAAKPFVFALCLWPFAWLCYGALADRLGANPAEYLIRATGDWALRFICIALAVTPLRAIGKTPALARLRRMFGLFAWFYAALHFLAYSGLDMDFEWPEIGRDIAKRPFIFAGLSVFALLTPLAATSFNRAIRALGAGRWRMLHRLVYLIALLALLHFFWMRAGKRDFSEVFVYAAIVAALLGWRVGNQLSKRSARN
jgi:sulfoxide reductase heme-binding subunit YedZ